MSVIVNTTVISNFACIGRLDLLRQLHGDLYIAAEVYEEIQTGIEEGYRFYASIPQLVHLPTDLSKQGLDRRNISTVALAHWGCEGYTEDRHARDDAV